MIFNRTMEIVISDIGFSAVHFIPGHIKCERLHGHNWRIGVSIRGDPDRTGMVADFGEIKKIIKNIVERYDHRILIPERNKDVSIEILRGSVKIRVCDIRYVLPEEDCVFLPLSNITCEQLSMFFGDEINKKVKEKLFCSVSEIFVEEKRGQGARYKVGQKD